MKIKSLLLCNVSFKIGSQRITLPAQSILELDDKEYAAFIPRLAKLVKEEEVAKWIKTPSLSKEDQAKADAAALDAAKKLVAEADKASKAGK